MNRKKGRANVYRVLLIVLSALAIGLGLIVEFLLPGNVGVPGWAVSMILIAVLLVAATGLRDAALTDKCGRMAGELEATKLDLDGVREALAAVRDQLDQIPDTGAVIAELRVLQGLMGQFPAKRGGATPAESAIASDETNDATVAQASDAAPVAMEPLPAPITQRTNPEPMLDYDDGEILHYTNGAKF